MKSFLETTVFSRSALIAGFFVLGFFIAPGAHAATNVSGNVSGTWNAAGSPYILYSATVPAGQTLTIEAGTVVKAASSSTLLTVNGTLNVTGTPLNKVTFTSYADDSAGQWAGILFSGSGATGSISNADIRYAGGGPNALKYTIGVFSGANVSVTGSDIAFGASEAIVHWVGASSLSLTSSYLHDFPGFAAINSSSGSLTVNDNTFSNVVTAATVNPAVNFTHSGNHALQAKGGIFYIPTGTLTQNQTWNADLPYSVGGITVPAGITLTIGEGAIVKQSSTLYPLTVNGALNVTGTPSNKVTFTSYWDDSAGGDTNGDLAATSGAPGQWLGILFSGSGATGSISNADIRYAGGGPSNAIKYGIAIQVPAANAVSITGSDISRNVSNGIYVTGGTVSVAGTDIHDHPGAIGLYAASGAVTVSNSSFHGNGTALYRSSGIPAVDARNNWWGSASGPRSPTTPAALGDVVSANVDFTPWLGYDPTERVAPSVSIIAGPTGTTDQADVAFEFLSDDLTATFLCRLDTPTSNGAYLACTSPQAYANLVDGAHAFHVVATDQAGNSSEAVREWTVQTTTSYKIAVILADLADVQHADASTLSQPCKLLDQGRTYATWREYYEDMFFCVNDFYDLGFKNLTQRVC